jgi:hypothetical protein
MNAHRGDWRHIAQSFLMIMAAVIISMTFDVSLVVLIGVTLIYQISVLQFSLDRNCNDLHRKIEDKSEE